MKTVSFFLLGIFISLAGLTQPISTTQVIPIGVTLNSILRLNVVSGGNIEFVVSTIKQYENGIDNASIYDTEFTVASSVDFDVTMYAETEELFRQGDGSQVANSGMPLNNIGYTIEAPGGTVGTNWTIVSNGVVTPLSGPSAPAAAIVSIAGAGAGDITQNNFIVNWELATAANMIGNAGFPTKTLLEQSLPSDRYVVNVFLILEAQ